MIWHGGLSGSVPLTIATPGHFTEKLIGIVPTSQTIFSSYNLIIVGALFILIPLTNRLMLGHGGRPVHVDPDKLIDVEPENAGRVQRPQVRHPERHLGVRGLAVPARRRHRAGAKLRSRHADQRPHIAMIGRGPD